MNTSDEWQGVVKLDWQFLNGGRSDIVMNDIYELAQAIALPSDFSEEIISDSRVNYIAGKPHVIMWQQIVLAEWNEM